MSSLHFNKSNVLLHTAPLGFIFIPSICLFLNSSFSFWISMFYTIYVQY